MCRIEFAEHCPVQPLKGPHGAEFRAAEHGRFPLRHLDPLHVATNAHGVLPREPVIRGEPSNPAAPPEGWFLAPSQEAALITNASARSRRRAGGRGIRTLRPRLG